MRAAEKRLVLQGRGTQGQAKYKSHWLFDQLNFRRHRENIRPSPEFER